jgi:hypothetical protein
MSRENKIAIEILETAIRRNLESIAEYENDLDLCKQEGRQRDGQLSQAAIDAYAEIDSALNELLDSKRNEI